MSNQTPVRVGIVGAGYAAAFHYKVLQRVYGMPLDIVGVTSADPAQHEQFAKDRGIRAFATVNDLIADVDVVDICAPPYVHESILIQAAEAGKHCNVEKPFTGSFLNQAAYNAQTEKNGTFNEQRYREAVTSAERMIAAVAQHGIIMNFSENWHFLPAGLKAARLLMQACRMKERGPDGAWRATDEIDPGARVLYIRAEESHSGSHSTVYGDLRYTGGGALVGKACHPIGFALYLKRLEGLILTGSPIIPVAVSGEIDWLTKGSYQRPEYTNAWKIRDNYVDGEDWSAVDVTFSDGTRARLECSELKLGGVYNWFEVYSNKFFLRGNINPTNALQAYAPSAEIFEPEYLTEKIETHGGWSEPAVDEDLAHGYVNEMQVFFERVRDPDRTWEPPYLPPAHDCALALDSIKVMYGAYVSAEREGATVRIDEPV